MNITTKVLCIGSLVSFLPWIPWLYQPRAEAFELANFTHRIEQSLNLARRRNRAYVPPVTARISRQNHSGGGPRPSSCGQEVALIAPRHSTIGLTDSTHPTLVWYSFSSSLEQHGNSGFLELHLYRYQADNSLEKVFVRPMGESRQGYMSYTLPQNEQGLNVGETYKWQVVAYCDPELEEISKWATADLEVVPPVATIASQLSEDSLDNAEIYAGSGLWYNAIAEINNLSTPAAESFRQDLLLDLADLEEQTDGDTTEKNSTQLRAIAEIQ
jgi:hypothetical protein